MKKLFLFSLIFTFFSIQAQFIEKPFQDLVHRERAAALSRMLRQPIAHTTNYDVKFYRLDLHPDLNSRNLSGTVVTYFVPNENLSNMAFDLNSQMTVSAVKWHQQNLNFSRSNNQLSIAFNQSLVSGVLDSVSVIYHGAVPNTGLDSYTVTTHGSDNIPVVWTLSEPYGARDWWPCKQDLTDKADSVTIVLHYPKMSQGAEMFGVSNGLLASETVATNTTTQQDEKISVWHHHYPIASYLVAFAITNYSTFSETAGISQHFPLINYVYPENLSQAQTQSADFLPVMNYFENTFGPYPFNLEKYGQIQFGWGGGMEHQTATFVVNYSRPLIAHELAHQWFGDAVTCGSWHDIWLNEGFATYSEALTREALNGTLAFDNWKSDATANITSQTGGSVYVQDTTDVWRIFDSRLSYDKGAMVLNMLRLKLGNQQFFQGIRNYVIAKKFQFAKTPDFKMQMESIYGQNLQNFFDEWIYGQGYPTYDITVTRMGNGNYDVLVNQTTSDASVPFFEMPLPFKFTDNQGQSFDTILNHTVNHQHFTVHAGLEATQIVFDAHHDIIKGPTQLNTILNIDLKGLPSLKIFPNPAKTFLSIKGLQDEKIIGVKFINSMGQCVLKFTHFFDVIDVNSLSQGLYLIQIQTPQSIYTKKIIKN